jgi:hypothetical protein
MARWPFFFYFIPSLPEILWKVGSLAWRVCAPRRVGLCLFLFQPSRVPLEGGLTHLGESACHGTLAFLFLFHSQPSRDPLEGGLTSLASPRAVARWPLSISFPAFQRFSGRWTCSPWQVHTPRRVGLYLFLFQPSRVPLEGGLAHLGESACHGMLVFLFLFHSQPSRDPLEGGLTNLASLRATARWPLSISFPAIQSSSGGWTHSPWRVHVPRHVGLYFFHFQPSRVPLEGGLAHLGESACHGVLAFTYFVPSLPGIPWKVGSFTW